MKKHFIICIFLFIFMHAQVKSQKERASITLKQTNYTENPDFIELPPETFSYRGVKDITAPVQMRLIEDEVDLSSVIQSLKRAKKSQYQGALWKIKNNFKNLLHGVKVLCQQSGNIKNCIDKGNTTLIKAFRNVNKELSSRVTYPYRYPDDISYFKQAIDSLDSKCQKCTDLNVAFAIMKSPEAQYNQLYNKIKEKDKICQKDIIQTLSNFTRFSMILPEKCQTTRDHPICKTILTDINVLRNRFPDMTKLVYGEDVSEQTEAQSICLECSQMPGTGKRWARSQFDFLEGLTSCSDLNLGEKKTHYLERVYGGAYTIKKDSDKNYSVNLTMEFFPDTTYMGLVSREEVPDHYMKRVQGCMQRANEKMLGPNGEKLHINIKEPSKEDDCRVKNIRVAIRGSNERSGVKHYSSNVECSTILHEIFHLLGLPDEYSMGNLCRVEVPESIMSQQYMRWKSVFNSKARNSLLDPAHFNSILHKNCMAKNRLYDECLRRSQEWPRKECKEKKQQCESKNLTGRNKQEEIEIIKAQLKEVRQNMPEEAKGIEEGRANLKKLIARLSAGEHGRKESYRFLEETTKTIRSVG